MPRNNLCFGMDEIEILTLSFLLTLAVHVHSAFSGGSPVPAQGSLASKWTNAIFHSTFFHTDWLTSHSGISHLGRFPSAHSGSLEFHAVAFFASFTFWHFHATVTTIPTPRLTNKIFPLSARKCQCVSMFSWSRCRLWVLRNYLFAFNPIRSRCT